MISRQGKLANVVYAAELARRYPKILSISVRPTIVMTGLVSNLNLANRIFIRVAAWFTRFPIINGTEKGCYSQLWTVYGAKRDDMVNVGLYSPIGYLRYHELDEAAKSETLARELWEWTEDVFAKV